MVAQRDLFLGKNEQPGGKQNEPNHAFHIRLAELSMAEILHDLVFRLPWSEGIDVKDRLSGPKATHLALA